MSIPDLAEDIVKSQINDMIDDNSRTIIAIGSKSAGKSNLLHNFLEKSDVPKETLVLEYSFGRKSSQKQTIERIICHVWEYGGRLEMLRNVLPSIPQQGICYYCVVLDLSKIKTLWTTLETCITSMKDTYEDKSVPELIIIGGKYDLFKNYDSEIRKHICTTIRSCALVYNANIFFYSSKEAQLVRRAKDIFHNIGFGSGVVFKEKCINYNKPLLIAKGTDSWDSIGLPACTIEQPEEVQYKYSLLHK